MHNRKNQNCQRIGDYCIENPQDCNRCIAEEEAWQKVQCFIECHGYDWTFEHLKHDYQAYYEHGYYCSHTFLDVVKNNEQECRLLFESEV